MMTDNAKKILPPYQCAVCSKHKYRSEMRTVKILEGHVVGVGHLSKSTGICIMCSGGHARVDIITSAAKAKTPGLYVPAWLDILLQIDGKMTIAQLAKNNGTDPTSIHETLNHLHQRGFLIRYRFGSECPYELSPAGLQLQRSFLESVRLLDRAGVPLQHKLKRVEANP